jgi:hypothetical protein
MALRISSKRAFNRLLLARSTQQVSFVRAASTAAKVAEVDEEVPYISLQSVLVLHM